jgi:hypothetical protein
VQVEKSALVALLLEAGEENAAVLLSRSPLPDELDTENDLEILLAFGLEREQVEDIARPKPAAASSTSDPRAR